MDSAGNTMTRTILPLLLAIFLLAIFLLAPFPASSWAQQPATDSSDDSSERTEESEEAYRRRMELEGARDSGTFSNTSYGSQVEQEKIDKLPPESQQNIRDQITDIIIENDQWEPSDVLEDYPYQPTEAAMKDAALREQEEEAWAEQVDKYHEREAAAFGATRPQMPGTPGPADSPGSAGTGQQQAGDPSGDDQQDQQQAQQNTAGGYDPGRTDQQNETSTAGVSESALDFLRGRQGQNRTAGNGTQPAASPAAPPAGEAALSERPSPALAGDSANSREQASGQAPDSAGSQATGPDGTILIEQLDQLQGLSGGQEARAGDPAQATAQSSADPESAEEASPEQMAQAGEQTATPAAEPGQESRAAQQEAAPEIDLGTAGIIAIRDLDKLEGVEEDQQEENP
jgi:hypothetical protein